MSGQALDDHRIRYTHRDRLGSVISLTDHNNLLMEHRSYDPFGKPRHGNMQDPLLARLSSIAGGTPFTTRGFTDHEHLDDAELIHMNGRVYDYNLGRFLSVDPFIQAPGNSQSMNPYSYIMNNPLAGTDPSGYVACAATDNCEKKPERQRESFSGGIVRDYIQVYWPAVNNGLTSGKQRYGKVTNVDINQIGAPAMASFSATPNEINVTNSQSETASLAKMFGYESPEEAEAAHEKLQAEIQDAIDRSIEVSMQTIRDSTSQESLNRVADTLAAAIQDEDPKKAIITELTTNLLARKMIGTPTEIVQGIAEKAPSAVNNGIDGASEAAQIALKDSMREELKNE